MPRKHVIKRSYNLVCGVKLGGHSYCGSLDIYFFHLSRDHIIKWSHDFEVEVPPSQVTTLSNLVFIDIADVQI